LLLVSGTRLDLKFANLKSIQQPQATPDTINLTLNLVNTCSGQSERKMSGHGGPATVNPHLEMGIAALKKHEYARAEKMFTKVGSLYESSRC
jgi:hypothetical protein